MGLMVIIFRKSSDQLLEIRIKKIVQKLDIDELANLVAERIQQVTPKKMKIEETTHKSGDIIPENKVGTLVKKEGILVKKEVKFAKEEICGYRNFDGRKIVPNITVPLKGSIHLESFEELEEKFGKKYSKTALFEPEDCTPKPRHRLAILIPYREDPNENVREDQLKFFLDNTIPILKRFSLKFDASALAT